MTILDLLQDTEKFHLEGQVKYQYNGIPVPRVTEIISSMIHEDYIVKWSNRIGMKRQKYETVLEAAADKGTYAHDAINRFLTTGNRRLPNVPYQYFNEVNNAFNAFLNWFDLVSQHNTVELLMSEEELVCPYFGGTLDFLVKINGKINLVDFKTSNNESWHHHVQLSAYRFILEKYMNIKIDMAIILMLSKKENGRFDEIYFDLGNIKSHIEYMNRCQELFLSIVYSYYNRIRVEELYNKLTISGGNFNGNTTFQ